MANVRQKPPELLQNQRGGRVRSLTVVPREGMKVPPCPRAVSVLARRVWNDFWRSRPAQAVEESDFEQLRWWIHCVDQREKYRDMVAGSPLIKGSHGQLMVNPLAREIRRLTDDIKWAADYFGMTPYSRFKLNLTYAEAGLKLADLRKQSETRPEQPDIIDLNDFA